MTEPDVTLTDYLLTLECGIFAYQLWKIRASSLRNFCSLFFLALAFTSFVGGTVHGFFLDESTLASQILWRLTLVGMGVVSFFSLLIGAHLTGALSSQRIVAVGGMVGLILYSIYVVGWNQAFYVAILAYLPSILFLLVAFFLKGSTKGVLALSIVLAASAIQYFQIALHPTYFNHNALYHLLQAIALAILFVAFRDLVVQGSRSSI